MRVVISTLLRKDVSQLYAYHPALDDYEFYHLVFDDA
jgi:hypothetical protein